MSDKKLDFSVDIPGAGKQAAGGRQGAVIGLLVLIVLLLGVSIVLALRPAPVRGSAASAGAAGGLLPEEERELALKLEERELYLQAARAWQAYLASDECKTKHTILFRAGDCLLKAGEYADALDLFYRAEKLDVQQELTLGPKIQSCLEGLGKYYALKDELAGRTAPDSAAPAANGTVLATIGSTVITENELKRDIERQVDMQLAAARERMPADQFNRQKEELIGRYSDNPGFLKQLLDRRIQTELLYRAGMEARLQETPDERRMLEQIRKDLLGERFIKERVLGAINLTDTDVQTYYRANVDTYTAPPAVRISVVACRDQKEAEALYGRITADESLFDKLAASEPLNKGLGDWIPKGGAVPGIGTVRELDILFRPTNTAGTMVAPMAIGEAWYIIRILDRREAQQRSFEEVAQQAAIDLYTRKYTELSASIVAELQKTYGVTVNEEWFKSREKGEKGE